MIKIWKVYPQILDTDHWIRIYYIVFSATDAGADYKLLKVEGGVYGPPSAPMEPNTNS